MGRAGRRIFRWQDGYGKAFSRSAVHNRIPRLMVRLGYIQQPGGTHHHTWEEASFEGRTKVRVVLLPELAMAWEYDPEIVFGDRPCWPTPTGLRGVSFSGCFPHRSRGGATLFVPDVGTGQGWRKIRLNRIFCTWNPGGGFHVFW